MELWNDMMTLHPEQRVRIVNYETGATVISGTAHKVAVSRWYNTFGHKRCTVHGHRATIGGVYVIMILEPEEEGGGAS